MSEKTYKGRGNYKTGGCCKFSCKNMNTKKCEDCFGFSKYEDNYLNNILFIDKVLKNEK